MRPRCWPATRGGWAAAGPATLGGWYAAVAEYSGATQRKTAELFAGDVFATLRTGASLLTSGGQALRVAAAPGLRPDRAMVSRLGLKAAPHSAAPVDCPANLNCQFVPAAYAEDPAAARTTTATMTSPPGRVT